MKNPNKTQNEKTAVLENLVTADAKRQAESLGIPLALFIGHLAAKADTMPVTIQVPLADFKRINSLTGDGRVAEWIESVVADVLECEIEEMEANRVTLDLPAKTAEKLRKAAEFEEMSIEEYLMDGLKRDLDLSADLMAAAKN